MKELSYHKEEREATRKNVLETDEFETKIKKALELRIGAIECASSKLICDLNAEKGLEMKRIKKIEKDRIKLILEKALDQLNLIITI